MQLSFVIPNYNGEEILQKNLPRVVESARKYATSADKMTEIIVVDDCSSDDSVRVIASIFESSESKFLICRLIRSKVNKGFSSTVNAGAKSASGEVLILLNTDAFPEKNDDFFSKALEYFSDPKQFAVGFMDKSIESNGEVVLRGRGVGIWKRGLLVHKKGDINESNTLWVSGGSSAYRKSIWDKLGGMNEMFNPFYWEDIDLSYRALKSGYAITFEKRCCVIHEHEKGAIKRSRSKFAIQTIAHRNQLFFIWLNLTDPSLLLTHVVWLPFHILNTLLSGDFAFLNGFIRALFQLSMVLQARRKFQKQFTRTDRDVVSEFRSEF
jgi:GT2 family glycosyltransferase